MARMLALLSLLVCISAVATQGSAQTRNSSVRTQPTRWVDYEPAVVVLKGKLIDRTYFGPPNYGENPQTDSKEGAWIVVLSRRINVRGQEAASSNATARNVKEVQLVLLTSDKQKSAKRMLGRAVTIRGTLFHAHTGHHHTEILMMVESIALAR